MAVFAYKATNHDRLAVSGTVAADTPRQARDMLRAEGLVIQQVVQQKAATGSKWSPRHFGRRYNTQVVTFSRELSTLLAVGIPMLESIDTIAEQHRGRFQSVLMILRDRVASGSSLAEAMREHPTIFDELSINITEVGQDAGTLESSLERLAHFKEKSLQLKNRVASSLIYPGIVLTIGLIVCIGMMTFVVPNLLEALADAGGPLPLSTRIVKACSDGLLNWWWLIAAGVAGLIFGLRSVLNSPRGRWHFDRLILKLPILGDMSRKQAMVRIALVISTLLRSGIVFDRSLEIAQKSTRNLVLRDALERCQKAVYAGRDIAESLRETGVFPPLVVQIFAAGQQSGRLEEMLDRLVVDYDQQVTMASTRLASILEPVLIVLLAILVGVIAFSIFMPILEAGDVL